MANNPGNPDQPKNKLPEQPPAVQVNPFADLHTMFTPPTGTITTGTQGE